ncbi:MAG: ribosomal protein L7/L12 [Planctomycetota bacterium]
MQLNCPRCQKPMPPLPGATDAQAQSIVTDMGAGRLINAIKTVREVTTAGLKEAKDYVDCPHRTVISTAAAPRPGAPRAPFEGRASGCWSLRQFPEDVQKLLVDLSQGWTQPGYISIKNEGMGGKIFLVVLGLGLVGAGLGFFLNYHRMPTPDLVWKCTPLVVLGLFSLFGGLSGALRLLRSTMKPCVIVNPAVLVRTTGRDVVEVYRWAAVTAVRPQAGFGVDVRFGDRSVAVACNDNAELTAITEAAAALRTSKEHDWLARVEEEKEVSRPGSGRALRFLLALPLGIAVIYGSWAAAYVHEEKERYEAAIQDGKSSSSSHWDINAYRYFATGVEEDMPKFFLALAPLEQHKPEIEALHDDVTWKAKAEKRNAVPVREYMKEFPKGRHQEDAKKLLHELYKDAEAKYVARAKGADRGAIEGVKALLAHLREKDDPGVGIVFMPVDGLEGAGFDAFAKEQTGSDKVEPVGPAFTKERNESRESSISSELKKALGTVFSDDLFLFEGKDKPGARFVVRHKVKGSGSYYTDKSEDKLPLAERRIYVGIYVEFEVTIEVGGEKFPVKIVAPPAKNFSVRNMSAVYDVMAQTAFDEFGRRLIKAYGIGE